MPSDLIVLARIGSQDPAQMYLAQDDEMVHAPWSKDEHRALKAHSKAKTPVVKISKQMKRTIGALRQRALKLGIGLGHQR
jgi:hypothetical protein